MSNFKKNKVESQFKQPTNDTKLVKPKSVENYRSPADFERKSVKIGKKEWELIRQEFKETDVPMIEILNNIINEHYRNKA